MKKFFVTVACFFFIAFAYGQSIKGVVIDGVSLKPISNVNIQIEFLDAGSNSNDKGEFEVFIEKDYLNLIFTHVNYDDHIEFVSTDSKFITVRLNPKTNIIDEISISATSLVDTISKRNQYSVSTYELLKDYIFWVENHGTFKKKLSFKNLSSDLERSIWLDTIKNIASLEKSCNQRMYLRCKDFAYPISIVNDNIILEERLTIKLYQEYVEPCKLRNGNDLFYVRSNFNGLQSTYLRYNIADESLNDFRTISEEELINGYLADLNIIRQSQGINNIFTNDANTNAAIRDIQEKGDFLNEVVYRPKVSNFLYKKNQNIVLLNHIENKIEYYHENQLVTNIDIQYFKSEKWLKHVVLDMETQEVYSLYKSTKGIELRRILIENGESEFVAYLDTDFPNYKSVKVHKGIAYFLCGEKVERSSKLLLSKVL